MTVGVETITTRMLLEEISQSAEPVRDRQSLSPGLDYYGVGGVGISLVKYLYCSAGPVSPASGPAPREPSTTTGTRAACGCWRPRTGRPRSSWCAATSTFLLAR